MYLIIGDSFWKILDCLASVADLQQDLGKSLVVRICIIILDEYS